MSGFLYRGRHCNENREAIPKSRTHMNDFSSDETGKGPPLQTHSLREFEKHLNDLKKENFSLKLRIYFLEERIQGKFEDGGSEDVHKKNIELRVEVESLKQELLERQQQLDKALTIETLTNQNGADVQSHCEERQQEISHIQEVLENKIQLLQEEAKLARSEAEKMASLAASESQRCVDLGNRMMETKETQEEMLAGKERLIQTLTEALASKEEEVTSVHEERDSLTHKVAQLEEELQVLSKSLQQKEKDVKILKEELEFGKNLKQLEMQCTHIVVNTHLEQWAAFFAAAPREQLGDRCLAQGVVVLRVEESAGHSLPPPTIPARPETQTRNLQVHLRVTSPTL
ncbi:hypothetical protein PDJAM_G00094900 [Pangasius djambal]|uniref:Uncharacterized protein n=1 Tax=Pangasius djambal TaxID=1691987 RepID=A0ACC5Z6N3_9TELE|nr:hypothetical protein [Pangasius djambal]